MDLLSMLLSSMTNESSVTELTKKSGGSSKGVSKLLMLAIPLIIGYMTKNAKASQSGSSSLLGALQQHTSTQTVSSQIANADAADGAAILNHVFGKDYKKIVADLMNQTGMTQAQVEATLANMAPALMSNLSAATTAASQAQQSAGSGFNLADGLDLSDIAALMGGSTKPQTTSSNLLGALLGGGSSSSSNSGLGNMLGALMGGGNTNTTSSMLSSLLGGSSSNQNALNGVDLLTALLGK